ncbi:MAG: glucodextranase DOMON-like domain-containing protein [Elusimicrobiota bacterium]
MKKNIKKSILLIIFSIGLFGCARRPVRIRKERVKEYFVFGIVKFHQPRINDSSDALYRNILGDWWDALIEIKKKHLNKELCVCVSGPVIRMFPEIQKNDILFESLIENAPDDLTDLQKKQLTKKYSISDSTYSILQAQIKECLNYLGEELKSTEYIKEFVSKDKYSLEDKNELINYLKEKIREFEPFLKSILENENVSEATTSLSDSYLNILNPNRMKVQIFESMINYKRWRGNFPHGFLPRGGYLNRESLNQLEKTTVKWIVSSATDSFHYLNTVPQIVYSYGYQVINSTTGLTGSMMNKPFGLIVKPEEFTSAVNNSRINFIEYDRIIDFASKVSGKETIKLSTSTFEPVELKKNNYIIKIQDFLSETREIINRYRNSGRASLETLKRLNKKLLIAESGEFCEEYKKNKYDRIFRKSLVNIYNSIGISPPIEFFIPVFPAKAYQPEQRMSSIIEPDCNGKMDFMEWEGAYKINLGSSELKDVYYGFDKENIYFMLGISSYSVSRAGVYVGYMNTRAASLFPRGYEEKIENIQDFPVSIEVNWRKRVPDKTVIYRAAGNKSWEPLTGNYEVGYSTGILEFTLPFRYLNVKPRKQIFFKIYTDDKIFPLEKHLSLTAPESDETRGIISYIDSIGDNYGPGNYKLFKSTGGINNLLDLKSIVVDERNDEKLIKLGLAEIDNPYDAPLGFSPPAIDLYIDVNGRPGLGRNSLLPGRKAYTSPEGAWEYCVTIDGFSKKIINTAGTAIGEPTVSVSRLDNTINIFISKEIIPAKVKNWGILPVLMAGDEKGDIIEIKRENGEDDEFTGRKLDSDTNIIDAILPPGYTQKEVLGANRKGKAIELPVLRK